MNVGVDTESRAGWERLGTLPVVAAVLVGLNGLYVALVAFGNITDYGTNQAFVQHVLAMDTTNFGAEPGTNLDPDVMWRAIERDWFQNAAYVAIIAWETATAVVLLGSLLLWVRDRPSGYRRARALSTIGLLMLVLLFMGGFIAIGGEWFQMWKSQAWNGIDAAFRNAVLALLALVVIHLPSDYWRPEADYRQVET
jgi:predicted small integral membrane protein